jgi:multidrug resistance efflux pump
MGSRIGRPGFGILMTVVRFDPPSMRKHDRVAAPAAVVLDDVLYATLQWSLGGFAIHGYRGDAVPGERRSVRFMLSFHGFEVGFGAEVEVVRVDGAAGTLAARYLDLGERERELLKHFLSGLVSGQITAVGDTIRHLDIPLHSLPAPKPEAQRSGWMRARELAGRSLLYLILGPILIGFAGLAAYRSFYRLEIQTAVVARPVESLVSLGTGRISGVFVSEGQSVAADQKLFSVEDDGVARELESARFDRDRARADLQAAQTASRSGDQRLDVYRSIAARKQTVARERVNALTAECATAQKQLERVQAVVAQGLVEDALLDQARAAYARAKGSLEEAKAELDIADDAVRAARRGIFYDGIRLVEDGPQLRTDESEARVRLKLAEERLTTAEARAGLLTCRAPFAGSVVRVAKSEASTVGRGEEVVFVERLLEAPRIQALLSQEEVGEVRVGSRVTVRIPALGKSYAATVDHVDRANLLSNPLLSNPALRPAWSSSADRSAWLSASLAGVAPRDQSSLRSGMPAVIMLDREGMASRWKEMVAPIRAVTRW